MSSVSMVRAVPTPLETITAVLEFRLWVTTVLNFVMSFPNQLDSSFFILLLHGRIIFSSSRSVGSIESLLTRWESCEISYSVIFIRERISSARLLNKMPSFVSVIILGPRSKSITPRSFSRYGAGYIEVLNRHVYISK